MKKILIVLALILSLTVLSGCKPDVFIEPDTITVVYENPHYSGSSFYIDVFITNGYETDELVAYMEFDVYSDDEELYVAGAGFDIDETIPANDYIWIELEFGSEFVFVTENQFNNSEYNLDLVVLLFWIE